MKFLALFIMCATLGLSSNMALAESTALGKTKSRLVLLNGLITEFQDKFGKIPTTEQGLDSLVKKGLIAQYPLDGWGNPFVYRVKNASRFEFELYSLGADGKHGGIKLNADVYK